MKVVVITGAGSGLGRSLARAFAADGHLIVLIGRTLHKLETVAREIGPDAMPVYCDVGSTDDVRHAFEKIAERFGTIDILFNNAAVFPFSRVAEVSDKDIYSTIDSGLVGPILCSRAAIPLMRRGSSIINLSSRVVERTFPGLAVYTAAKAGLEGFSRSLIEELEPSGIMVTIVRTGMMIEDECAWDTDVGIAASANDAAAHGVDARSSPYSTFASVARMLRDLTELPSDIRPQLLTIRPGREPDQGAASVSS
jgi:meso-butanediol dehydrogenase / (S,S)-butanediol dehydrogenase / diacetyl reductase